MESNLTLLFIAIAVLLVTIAAAKATQVMAAHHKRLEEFDRRNMRTCSDVTPTRGSIEADRPQGPSRRNGHQIHTVLREGEFDGRLIFFFQPAL
jgi:hypothetical protein